MASITISLDIGDLNLIERYATGHGMKTSKAAATLIRRGMASVIAEAEALKKFQQKEGE